MRANKASNDSRPRVARAALQVQVRGSHAELPVASQAVSLFYFHKSRSSACWGSAAGKRRTHGNNNSQHRLRRRVHCEWREGAHGKCEGAAEEKTRKSDAEV